MNDPPNLRSPNEKPRGLLPSLLRIAETSLTVGDIAETDLFYVEPHWTATEAFRRMSAGIFDIAPVNDSRPYRYVSRASLEVGSGTVEEEAMIIDAAHLVTSTLGLTTGISLLQPEGFYFVLAGDRLSGIVTYADLQKAPVSMVALALILAAEVGMSRLIAGWLPDTWWGSLSDGQQSEVLEVFEQRRRNNTEISLLECLTLPARMKLLLKHPVLRAEFSPKGRGQFDRWERRLIDLRDTLAHGGTILAAAPEPVHAIDLLSEVRNFAERVWKFAKAPEVDAPTEVTPAVAIRPSTPRKEIVRQRVENLTSSFGRYAEAYDRLVPFTSEQLAAHRDTIRLRREAGSVGVAIRGDDFLRSLHRTLFAWGLGVRGSSLADEAEFAQAIRATASAIEELDPLAIDDGSLPEDTAERLWGVIEELNIVDNKAKIVAGTKALHHLLPELVVPMDRTWTGKFFQLHAPEWQGLASSQRAVFARIFRSLAQVARTVLPQQYVTGEGWRTCRTKIIDNALIGFCKLELN